MKSKNIALLIIDMQTDFLLGFSPINYKMITESISTAIEKTKDRYEIINITWKGQGDLDPCVLGFDESVEKEGANAFLGTNLDKILKARNIKTVIPAGINSYACVDATARGAEVNKYKVLMCKELLGGCAEGIHEAYLKELHNHFKTIGLSDLYRT